jgi:hypothetical protein
MRNSNEIVAENLEEVRPFGRPKHILQDNIKMDLRRIAYEVMNCIRMTQVML